MDTTHPRRSVTGTAAGGFDIAAVAGSERLERIESRVLRIERHLGLAPQVQPLRVRMASIPPSIPVAVNAPAAAAAPPSIQTSTPVAEMTPRSPPPLPVMPAEASQAPVPTPLSPESSAADRFADLMRIRESARGRREGSSPPPLPPPLPPPAPPPTPPPPQWEVLPDADAPAIAYEAKPAKLQLAPHENGWEQIIGLKLAGWVGAIVLVIGLGLGIKYAYDEGWLGLVRPSVRLGMMYVVGFGLIGAGEIVYRRINKISATGLFGAGIAMLFLVSYAGHGYYKLYQRETAFTLMALSTLIGAAVAMRGRLVSIAALALLGGLLAPLVLESDSHLITPFLAYLLMLQVVALVLSWWGGTGRWWMLRSLSLVGTSIWTATLLLPHPPAHATPILCFAILYAVLYQLEVIVSTIYPTRSSEEVEEGAGVSFSVLVTALLTAALLWIMRDAADAHRGLVVVAISATTLALDLALRRLGDRVLAKAFRIQSIVLLLIAVPVAFSGSAITIGWAGAALALAAVGGVLNDRPARLGGIAAWIGAVVYLLAWVQTPETASAARAQWLILLGEPIAAWTVLAWGLVLCGHAVAWLVSRAATDLERNVPVTLSCLASALFVAATIAALPPLGATGAMLAYTWILVVGDFLRRAGPSPGRFESPEGDPEDSSAALAAGGPALRKLLRDPLELVPQSAVLLALSAMKWIVIDTLADRLAPGWSPAHYRPILNPLFLTGVAIGVSIMALYCLRREGLSQLLQQLSVHAAAPAVVILSAVSLLVALGLSLEIDRVVMQLPAPLWPRAQLRQMAWTLGWTMLTVAYFALYARLDTTANSRPSWRRGVTGLIALLALKFCLVDTALWWWTTRDLPIAPLLNMQMLTAACVVGGIAALRWIARDATTPTAEQRHDFTGYRAGLAALGVILWAGTIEIDRLIAGGFLPGALVWPNWQIRNFAWSAWWMVGVVGFLAGANMRDATILRRMPALRVLSRVPILIAAKYLILDTLAFRLWKGPAGAMVVANLQTFAGACLFAGLILLRHLLEEDPTMKRTRRIAGAAAMIMLLWLGSLEIDRAFVSPRAIASGFADPALAEQVALSIYWSLFAIAAVAFGFKIRLAGLRYFGLALFALTLAKVAMIDLRHAETGYRILSFFGLGGLLLGTSVLYGKLSSTVLAKQD